MVRLQRIVKDYAESGALSELVGIHAAVDEHLFLTKSGALVATLRVRGIDDECLDASQLADVVRRVEAAWRAFDDNFRLYQYLVKRRHPAIPASTSVNPVVQAAVASRAAHLASRDLYAIEIYWAVCYEGWGAQERAGRRFEQIASATLDFVHTAFSDRRHIAELTASLDRACETLALKIDRLVVELQDIVGLERLDTRAAFRFFYGLLNPAAHKQSAAKLRYDQFVDYQLAGSPLECHRDHLQLDQSFVEVLTVKEAPAQTRAALLKSVQAIASEFVLVTEWRKVANDRVRAEIRSKRRHFHNARASFLNYIDRSPPAPGAVLIDRGATALADDLGACLEEMELRGRSFGEWSLTIVLQDEDRARLRRAVAACYKACAGLEITLVEERYNLLNAFLATLPGNDAFNLRRMWLMGPNHADLAPLFAPHAGLTTNAALSTEYLAALESNCATPYFFNLHHQDIAHTLVLGATGSGKSFFVNFALTHLQKYDPLTFIFDLGGSYEGITRLFQGTSVSVNLAQPTFSINPFSLPPTAENLSFLLAFLRVLAESAGYRLTARDERDLHEQIENLYSIDPSQRRLLTLVNILNRTLREQLSRWVAGGPYGFLFDNVEDTLTFARFQTFDFEGMDKQPQILEPLLFYILHRAHASIADPRLATTFKVFVLDEAWRLLRHPAIRAYVEEGFKTWRKRNAAVVLITQSGDDLFRSELLPVVVESCPTKLFLANSGADVAAYREAFHLNETEANLITRLERQRQVLLKRPDHAKVLNLDVGAKDYWLYTNNPKDNHKKREAFEQHGFEGALEILARSSQS